MRVSFAASEQRSGGVPEMRTCVPVEARQLREDRKGADRGGPVRTVQRSRELDTDRRRNRVAAVGEHEVHAIALDVDVEHDFCGPGRRRCCSRPEAARGGRCSRSVAPSAAYSTSSPSWQISSVSIATSFAAAFSAGPVHLHGQPRRTNRITSWRLSSSNTIVPSARCTCPSRNRLDPFPEPEIADHTALRAIFVNFFKPGSFRTVMFRSVRSSIGVTSTSRPETSLNEPRRFDRHRKRRSWSLEIRT